MDAPIGGTTPTLKPMKLKLRQRSSSRAKLNEEQSKPPSKSSNKKELYGLDVDFLEGLGLGELIDEVEKPVDPS